MWCRPDSRVTDSDSSGTGRTGRMVDSDLSGAGRTDCVTVSDSSGTRLVQIGQVVSGVADAEL